MSSDYEVVSLIKNIHYKHYFRIISKNCLILGTLFYQAPVIYLLFLQHNYEHSIQVFISNFSFFFPRLSSPASISSISHDAALFILLESS